MSTPPPKARLIISLLSGEDEPRRQAVLALVDRLGPLLLWSQPMAFDWSSYYQEEMGSGLTRRLAVFERLLAPLGLAEVKLLCQEVERDFALDGRRRVNLDPGLVSADSLILATSKFCGHRLPLAPGVFGEITLFFSHGRFHAMPWTYLDYKGPEMIGLLTTIRQRYLCQLKKQRRKGV